MKKIIFSIITFLVIGAFTIYHFYSKTTPDVVNQEPDMVIEATELISAFTKDSVKASRMYLNKIIEINGTIQQLDTTGALVLGADDNLSVVAAGFDRRHLQDLTTLKKGTNVTIQGICTGYNLPDINDLLSALGTTIQLSSAGIKSNK